jgi:hypothetical protein
MPSRYVVCQAPKAAPRSKIERREFVGGRCGRSVPRKMTDQVYCSNACRQRAHYWGLSANGTDK